MSNGVRQMPGHIEAAYKEVVNNIFFIKRQQWVTTNYTILVYAAIFIVSAEFFTRTDLARGWLGLITFLTFFYHLYMIKLFQDAITSFRDRLAWIYRSYFSADEQVGLNSVAAAGPLLASSCRAAWPYSCLSGRSCLDSDLLILSPMNTRVRTNGVARRARHWPRERTVAASPHQIIRFAAAITIPVTNAAKKEKSRRSSNNALVIGITPRDRDR